MAYGRDKLVFHPLKLSPLRDIAKNSNPSFVLFDRQTTAFNPTTVIEFAFELNAIAHAGYILA